MDFEALKATKVWLGFKLCDRNLGRNKGLLCKI